MRLYAGLARRWPNGSHPKPTAGRTYFFSEREYGAFQRSFRLPPDAAADRIDAAFKNGVLNVRIPKLQPATLADTRKVQVRTE
jgi:HSP20 family protein